MFDANADFKTGRPGLVQVLLAAGVSVLVGMTVASPAEAKIKCKGIFQMNKSGPISTLYCQDLQIARVARSYGWRVTDEEVRNKPLKKVQICQAIGGDVRLQGACGAYSSRNFY